MNGAPLGAMPPPEVDNLEELDPNDIIGVIKIKDGLFICDELGA